MHMPTEFKLPELGENVTAGDVVRVLVAPGDTIAKDQPILELETDKATIEVPSSVAGTVQELRIKEGDKVKVGQVVLTLDAGGGEKAQPKAAKPPAAKEEAKPKAQPPGAAEEGGLRQKAVPRRDAPVESGRRVDPDAGRADQPEAQQAEVAAKPKRGEVVDISRGARPAPSAATSSESAPAGAAPEAAPAAPSVRRLARDLGVDIHNVAGSGPEGRISVEDVQAHVRGVMGGSEAGDGSAAGEVAAGAATLPDFSRWGEVDRKAMSNIRRKTAAHLSQAWRSIAHVTQHDKADITALEQLRTQYAAQTERAGGKLTLTAIALKIVAAALRRFPQFNASIDVARNEIVFKRSVHVGVAVDTERGLLVPVIRDVDSKGILELAAELAKASEKARGGKLSLDDMQGGGFTITNLGGIGGTSFTPIVNWPEVAILGISRGSSEPVYNGSQFEPRLMLPLSLSYDHRVIDGADAARFLRWIAEAFEQPFVLAL
jgi:pyruvate dehydrogenase E2 component (dihydrolipoamide acetyltransferase)